MRLKILTLFVIISFLSSCCEPTAEEETTQTTELTETVIPTVGIGEFDAKAGEYVDKQVQVAGIVDHLCKHGGKKLFMVADDGDLHVESEERFDESLSGQDIVVTGFVREFRVDEAYCLKMEEDNIASHKSGDTEDDLYERKMKQIEYYRDSMSTAGTDHLSYYSLEYVSHKEKK